MPYTQQQFRKLQLNEIYDPKFLDSLSIKELEDVYWIINDLQCKVVEEIKNKKLPELR